jgi:hypothetical protein
MFLLYSWINIQALVTHMFNKREKNIIK